MSQYRAPAPDLAPRRGAVTSVPARPGVRSPLGALRARVGAVTSGQAQDSGQILLLSIAYGVLALLLVTAVVSASSVHIERKRLWALADQAALEAADAVDSSAFYGSGTRPDPRTADGALVPLSTVSVRTAVDEHLARSPGAQRLTGVQVMDVGTDGRTVHVTLGALARPPLLSWVTGSWSEGITLRVTSSARAG
ncbi:pilus assembly protein TadG-related protein [Actinotalea sp. K2]|uniref:pilus assembly protein TadG-related protein n=1 Tax=Actinotalea sp. K2 TaxID=2939438 RepID=UPI002016E5DA|nr:pilus assembly protein TadG-related protein [Actinotalea sp. K2]MCL3860400.1 pilus assembly protein TadG-related protein [Actinotalea sp. K2]